MTETIELVSHQSDGVFHAGNTLLGKKCDISNHTKNLAETKMTFWRDITDVET